jgi:hypothetical protein
MNFQELIGKINEFDKPMQILKEEKVATLVKSDFDLNAVKKLSGLSEDQVAECGMPMPGPMGSPNNDPVTLNVSMNARGTDSIRDLLDILKGNMHGDGDDSVEGPKGMIIGMNGPKEIDLDEKFENEPEEEVATVADVTNPPSNDLNRPKQMYQAAQPGDNPMAAREFDESTFKTQLKNLYQEVKNR